MVEGSSIARFSHGRRFALARRIVSDLAPDTLLDYGAGQGYLLSLLDGLGIKKLRGYDPIQPGPRVSATIEDVSGSYDCVTCLEVLEHLEDHQIEALLADVRSLLAPGGTFVASVPVMIGPAGFVKIAKEMHGSKLGIKEKYTLGAAIRSLILRPQAQRWKNPNGIFYHLNFDHRPVRARLRRKFGDVREITSPFSWLPSTLASQVFFVCRSPT